MVDSDFVSVLAAKAVGVILEAAKTREEEEGEAPQEDEEACLKWQGLQKVGLGLMEEDAKHLGAMEVLPIQLVD